MTANASRRRAFSLVDLSVVVVSVALCFLTLALLYSAAAKKRMYRAKCLANMEEMGKAVSMYIGDNCCRWPWYQTSNEWSAATGSTYDREPDANTNCNVSSLMFMLVRNGQSPDIFVCPATEDRADANTTDANGRYHYDFTPYKIAGHECVSYSYQVPTKDQQGQWHGVQQNQDLAISILIADRTPTYDGRNVCIDWTQVRDASDGLSDNHGRSIINVLYQDVHAGVADTPDCGYSGDNIYTCVVPKTGQDAYNAFDPGAGTLDVRQHRSIHDSFLIGPTKMEK